MFLYIECNFQIVRYMKKDAKCGVGRKIDAYFLYTWKVCALESVVCQRSLVHVDIVIGLGKLDKTYWKHSRIFFAMIRSEIDIYMPYCRTA